MFKPRLLPLAIIAMGSLFLVKSENVIRPLLRGEPSPAPAVAPLRAAEIAPPLTVAPEPTRPPGGFQRLGDRPEGGLADAPNPITQAERALLEQLRARRAELEAREQTIASRELVLAAAERRLGQRIEELTQLQQRLEGMERTRNEREEAGWRGLVRTYENMRPREAAAIFEELELPVVIQILDRMGERKMAPDKNINVLIVDDYRTMLRIIRNLLKQLEFNNVDEAVDGQEALAKLRAGNFGLVISDWNMAPMTGLDLLKEVRADQRLKNMPFIMITAESKTENVVAAKQAGVSNYIVKPFNAETLREKIEKVLVHA